MSEYDKNNAGIPAEGSEMPSKPLTSEGLFTLILPHNDRTDLLVRCLLCQRIFIGMEGFLKYKKGGIGFKVPGNQPKIVSKTLD